jgi:predicted DNA-binding transcriptional regulator YafY
MSEILLRQWLMLGMIPREPRKIHTSILQRRLEEQGYPVSRRTIQRDLQQLAVVFPLRCDESAKPYGWQWMQDGKVMDIPGMEPAAALAFQLAETYLKPLLPRTMLRYLDPHFRRAREILAQMQGAGVGMWPAKVRVISRGPALLLPEVKPEVQEIVYQALFEERRFAASYRSREASKPSDYDVNPLGLVFRHGIIYLVCTFRDSNDIRQLALHRMISSRLLDSRRRVPPGFSLDTYIRQGEFGYPVSREKIKLRVLFDRGSARHLYETPLSPDQKLKEKHDGRVLLEATVLDTLELRWWLLGFGDGVEVLEPKKLRSEFKRIAQSMAERYRNTKK